MTDPRPLYAQALDWVQQLLAGIPDGAHHAPTGCADFDVTALAGHLVATVERARVIGEGGDPTSVPLVIQETAEPWASRYAEAATRLWPVWQQDDALDRTVRAPWGEIPGWAAVWSYLNETLVHGWDLARATGQGPEARPALAEAALAMAPRVVPAEPRRGHVPFAPVVEPRPEAGPTERLARWSGRS